MSEASRHDVFQAIADPTRRQLLHLLSEKEQSITELCVHFPISRPGVSKHLRILAEAGLVIDQKFGREKRYSFNAEPLQVLHEWLQLFWDNKLIALQQFVEKNDCF